MKAIVVILFSVALFSQVSAAQTVYKCKINGSTVYSEQPCSTDARKQTQVEFHNAPQSSAHPAVIDGDGRDDIAHGVALSQAGIDESNCNGAASNSIYRSANDRINQQKAEIQSLENQTTYAKNNLAGATYESGLRTQIGALQTAIATEQASADSQMAGARQRCSDERRRTEDAINKEATAKKH